MLYSKCTLPALSFFCTSAFFASSIHQSTAVAQEDIDYPGLPGSSVHLDPCLGYGNIPAPCPQLVPGQVDTCEYRFWRRTNTEYNKYIVKNAGITDFITSDPWIVTEPCDCRYVYANERRQCPTARTVKSSETMFCWNLGAKVGMEVSGGTVASLALDWGLSVEISGSVQSCKKLTEVLEMTLPSDQCFSNKARFSYTTRSYTAQLWRVCRYSTWLDQNDQIRHTEDGGRLIAPISASLKQANRLEIAPARCPNVTVPSPDPYDGVRAEPCTQRVKGCHEFQGDATCGIRASH